MKFNENTLATLVLYKTTLNDSKTFLSLTASLKAKKLVLDLVVYDNSPEYNKDIIVDHPNWRITYIADINNSGISKAYNSAAAIAVSLNKKWIMFFDQDTDFPVDTIDSYIKAINEYPAQKLFVPLMLSNTTVISPCGFKFMRGSVLKNIAPGLNDLNNTSVINCGICVDIDAFQKNNGYNELLKLDFSDHDFVRRFKNAVTSEFVLIDLKVQHELSSESKNSMNSDLIRFGYYLSGAKNISASVIERYFLRFNATMRGLKLSLIHHNFSFLIKSFKK